MSQSKSQRLYYYYSANGKRRGPISANELRLLAATAALAPTDTVWEGENGRGVYASQVKGLFTGEPLTPQSPALQPGRMQQDQIRSFEAFISYSSKDKPVADAICARLERDNVRCWIAPRDVLPGSDYADSIMDGINSTRLMILVLSSASNGSRHVRNEVERAVSKGIQIIPFRIENVVLTKSMELYLSSPHWLDALTKPLEGHIESLLSAVRTALTADRQLAPDRPLAPDRQLPPGVDAGAPIGFDSSGSDSRSPQKRRFVTPRRIAAFARRSWSRVPFSVRVGGLGIALVTAIAVAAVVYLTPNPLKRDYEDYRREERNGRGSGVFLQRATPLHYDDWRARADAGNPIAQLFIGRCYQEGLGDGGVDAVKAISLLHKARAQGNDCAMYALGLAWEKGQGVQHADRSEALKWYTRAAALGNTAAMRAAGWLYRSGVDGRTRPELALDQYKEAAEAGDPVARRLVGYCYCNAIGVKHPDPVRGEEEYKKAEEAGDPYMVGKSFGNRLAIHFAAYLARDATASSKTAAIEELQKLKNQYEGLDFACLSALFSASHLRSAMTGLQDLRADDDLCRLHGALTRQFMRLYADALRSQRIEHISAFSLATSALVERWFREGQFADVVDFWEHSYKDIPIPQISASNEIDEISSSNEIDELIRELNWTCFSLMRTGKGKEAAELLDGGLQLCDRALKETDDWALKEAYADLCFDAASAGVKLRESADPQLLLRRAWSVRIKQYGKEKELLTRYTLPLKGNVPAGATGEDREFFERFATGNDKKKSSRVRFTIRCSFSGKQYEQYPFFIYVISGKRGHEDLLEQFGSFEKFRGGKVSQDDRDQFTDLNGKASKDNKDFMELCVDKLGDRYR
jgi:hypothetical protein